MQVDNLRTNHRGTFVLKDLSFRWLAKLSVDPVPSGTALQNGAPPVHPAAGQFSQLQCTAYVFAAALEHATRRRAVASVNALLRCTERAQLVLHQCYRGLTRYKLWAIDRRVGTDSGKFACRGGERLSGAAMCADQGRSGAPGGGVRCNC